MKNFEPTDPFQEILKNPPPTKEENAILISNAIAGDEEDKWELVLRNVRLVYRMVQKHHPEPWEEGDMLLDGIMGFYEAVGRLIPCEPEQFSSYGCSYIIKEIRKNRRLRHSQFNSTAKGATWKSVSMNDVMGDGPNPKMRKDVVPDINAVGSSDLCEGDDVVKFCKRLVRTICVSPKVRLSKRERDVFRSLIRHKGDTRAVAEEFGLSRQRIHQVWQSLAKKISKYCKKRFGEELEDIFGTDGRQLNLKLKRCGVNGRISKKNKKSSSSFSHLIKERRDRYDAFKEKEMTEFGRIHKDDDFCKRKKGRREFKPKEFPPKLLEYKEKILKEVREETQKRAQEKVCEEAALKARLDQLYKEIAEDDVKFEAERKRKKAKKAREARARKAREGK